MRAVIHKAELAMEAFSKFSFISQKMVKNLLCSLKEKENETMLICEGDR